nr:hypothetical protein HmN_000708400 [Hymenolepis microstoma]CUU99427.1 hypothetical transcript [Hymenolepis microstoma]
MLFFIHGEVRVSLFFDRRSLAGIGGIQSEEWLRVEVWHHAANFLYLFTISQGLNVCTPNDNKKPPEKWTKAVA